MYQLTWCSLWSSLIYSPCSIVQDYEGIPSWTGSRASGFSRVPFFDFQFSGMSLACRVVFIMCSTSQPSSECYLTIALCPPRPRHPFWPYPFRALSLVIQVCLYWIASLRVLQASEWDWLRFYRSGDFPLLLTPKTRFRSGSQQIISLGSCFLFDSRNIRYGHEHGAP